MNLITLFQKITHSLGVSIRPYTPSTHHDLRLMRALKHFEIDLVLDVGANIGQYGVKLYSEGYNGKIISFEPIPRCHAVLVKEASNFKNWEVFEPCAIGDGNYTSEIHISKNTVSSSLLNMSDTHVQGAPDSVYIDKEEIQVKSLDSLGIDFDRNIFLKIDVQGYEFNVLKGAESLLSKIRLLSVELSLAEVYDGATNWKTILQYLEDKGFYLYGLNTAFVNNETGQVLQIDGIFAKYT